MIVAEENLLDCYLVRKPDSALTRESDLCLEVLSIETLKNEEKFGQLMKKVVEMLADGVKLFKQDEIFDALYFLVDEPALRRMKPENLCVLQASIAKIMENFKNQFLALYQKEDKVLVKNCALGLIYLTCKLLVGTYLLHK